MTTGTQNTPALATLDAWTLTSTQSAPTPGATVYSVRHQDGRVGVMRVLERANAGPDGGQGVLDVLGRLDRVVDPRVVKLMATGMGTLEGKDVLYVVAPAVQGPTLQELTAEGGALLANEVLGLLVQTAEALSAAHGVGVPHGNLGPHALYLLPQRKAALADFGLVPWPRGAAGPQRVLPSPELRKGGAATFAGDVYALALTGVGLICGQEAFRQFTDAAAGTEVGLVQAALEKTGAVTTEVARMLVAALHPDPVARPSAISLANQLRPHAAQLPEIAPAGERSKTPAAVAVSARVTSWLGEASDPRKPAPAPITGITAVSANRSATPAPSADNPFGPSPTGNFEIVLTESSIVSMAPTTSPGEAATPAPVQDNRDNITLPPPPSAFLGEAPKGPPPAPPNTFVEVPRTPAAPSPAHSVSVLPALSTAPVIINLSAVPLSMPRTGDFPVVARWTDGKGNKGQGPVEIVRPKASAGHAASGGGGAVRLVVLAIAVALGMGLGLVAGRGCKPQPGGVRVESSLADTEVDITVEMDGRTVGKAPLDITGVSPGTHMVVLRAEGAEPSFKTVDVVSGVVAKVTGAPEFLGARLLVTCSVKGATVQRDEDKPVPVPAEFDDLEPDADVALTFRVNGQVLQRTVRLPVGELHYHLDVGGKLVTPEPVAVTKDSQPPPPPPPPPPPTETARPEPPARQNAADAVTAGNKALLAGDFDGAQVAMKRALQLDANNADALKGLGIVYARKNAHCDSLRYYRRYLDARPKATDADRVRSMVRELEAKAPDCT